MNFFHRRKPLARIFLLGFASVMAGGTTIDALAQASAPLRVDPVLLGLPPVKPAEPAVTAVPAKPASVEVKPVSSAVVEVRPAENVTAPAPAAVAAPAQVQAPAAPAPVVTSAPVPSPAPVRSPVAESPKPAVREEAASLRAPAVSSLPVVAVPATSAVRPVDTAAPKATATAAPTTPSRPLATAAQVATSSTLGPLRVDPALLGLPPVAARESVAPVGVEGRPAVAAGTRSDRAPEGSPVPAPPGPTLLAKASSTTRKSKLDGQRWYERLWAPIPNAYDVGSYEFYLPFKTYHLRSAYSEDKIATYQEKPKGFGVGRGFYNERGNWEGVYAMAFQDSHFKPMYMAGYGWQAIWRPAEDTRIGLGYVGGLMSRSDIWGYAPFPIVLPAASIAYKNFSLNGAFVPGGGGWGNVAFFWAKWELGKNGERIGTPAKPAPVDTTEYAQTTFGEAVPLANRRVPYGPVLAIPGESARQGSASGEVRQGVRTGAGPVGGTGVATGVTPERPLLAAGTQPPLVAATGPRDEEEVPDPTPALMLKSTRAMTALPKESEEPRPVFLSGHRMGGDINREFNAEGDAELRKVGTVLTGDRLTYWPIEDEAEAEGNVRLEQGSDVITGPKMRLRIEDQIGYFEQPVFQMKRQPLPGSKAAADNAFAEQSFARQNSADYWNSGFALPQAFAQNFDSMPTMGRTMSDARGEAERAEFEGENHYRLFSSAFTTCAPGNNDWYLKTEELKLDFDSERGTGDEGTIYFKDVPIFYSPWLSFSLNRKRQSGLLAPSFGTTSNSGLALSLPYYWDIAPNMDATLTPRVMGKRGLQLNTEFRYLNTAFGGQYTGEARLELLPNDNARSGESRYGLSLRHQQTTANGLSGLINYNKVSDDTYFTDLSSTISSTSQAQLVQQAVIGYGGGGWWSVAANFQGYQTLQPDPKNPVAEPYRMLPQLTFNARKPDLFMTDASFMGQFTSFTKPEQVINGVKIADPEGQRLVLYPQIALPYVTPGWYVTPKLGANIRQYSLTRQTAGLPTSITTTLPIASLDSGMTFERNSRWFGKDYTQTLEPRLYYVNIPYKNQDSIPIFDTGLADFNFAQIFSENQFSSWDRINNANQLTAAVSSRLLDPQTGTEIVRAMVGERLYFSRNRVALSANTLSSTDDRNWDRSDFLSAFSGQILPKVYADLAMQYNFADEKFKRQSVGVRYLPEAGKVLNAAYRYNADTNAPTNQIDLSAQWPLTGRLSGVGRFNYSFKDAGTSLSTAAQSGRVVQAVAGLEYNGGCWVLRGVVQKVALTATTTSSSFFVQLELNDFTSIGSNPISMLRRNIQGYGLINEPASGSDYLQ